MKNKFNSNIILAILLVIVSAAVFLIKTTNGPNNLQTDVVAAFSDVPDSHKYTKAITFLRQNEIVKGYNDGTFRPENSLTRAEFTKIIVLGTNQNFTKATKAPFSDVALGEWYTDYIAYCSSLGFLKGYGDGTFKPNQAISKVEALKILGELVNWDTKSIDPNAIQVPYSDLNLKDWYGPYASYAISKNLLDDTGSNFHPDAYITRGQMSEYIYRDYVVRELGVEKYDQSYDADILGHITPAGTANLNGIVTAEMPDKSYFAQTESSDSEYQEIVEFAKEKFLENHPNKDTLIAFMEPLPYAAGSEIAAYDFSSKDGKKSKETLKKDSWLLFIDDYPEAEWQHPTQFVIIDKATQQYKIRTEKSWPVVNNYSLWSHKDMRERTEFQIRPSGQNSLTKNLNANISSPDTLMAADDKPVPYSWDELDKALGGLESTKAKATTMRDLTPLCECVKSAKNKFAILIDGMDEAGYIDEITRHIKTLPENWELLPAYKGLKQQGYQVTLVTSETGVEENYAPEGTTQSDLKYATLANVSKAFSEVASKAECCDEVIVVIYGHGDGESVAINPKRYLPRTDLVKKDGKWELISLEPVPVGSDEGGALTAEDIKALLDSLNVCRQKVVIVSCYSGGLLEKGIGKPASEGCSCRTTYVSSAADKITYNSTDGIVAVMGKSLENGSSFLSAFFDAYKSVIDRKERSNYPIMEQSSTSNCEDPDGDGICSGEEISKGMDPNNKDSDGDGIGDYVEGGLDDKVLNPTDPVKADTDGDGLGDGAELKAGTDPHNPDTDGDKISDGDEVIKFGLNPLSKDTDGEGYEDYDDLYDNRTNPLNPDTDGDSCTDWEEVDLYKTDPSDPKDKGYNCGCLSPQNKDDDTCVDDTDDDTSTSESTIYRYAFECKQTIEDDPGFSTKYKIEATIQLVDENGKPMEFNLPPELKKYYTTSVGTVCGQGEFAGGQDDAITECYNPVKDTVESNYFYDVKEFYPEYQTTEQINEIVTEMWNEMNDHRRSCE